MPRLPNSSGSYIHVDMKKPASSLDEGRSYPARFRGRTLSRVPVQKTYIPSRLRFALQKQTRAETKRLQEFNSIRPHPPQTKAIRRPVNQQSNKRPRVLEEPANLRKLRAENALIDKLPDVPTTELPGGSKVLPFGQKALSEKISQATTAKELVQIWNHLNNRAVKELLTFEPYLNLKYACSEQLYKLCSKPDQAKQITDDTLKMFIDPRKRRAAKIKILETRLNDLRSK